MTLLEVTGYLFSFIFMVSGGQWSDWQPFGPCKLEVVGDGLQKGFQTRTRFCLDEDNEFVHSEEDEAPEECQAGTEDIDKRECRIPTVWTNFKALGECSVTCGLGKKLVSRQCILSDKLPSEHQENDMCQLGSVDTTQADCRKRPCPKNGGWSEWSPWGPCGSEDCLFPGQTHIKGKQYKLRTCSNPAPKNGGKMCEGAFIESGVCFDPINCPTDGTWGVWSDWSKWNCELGSRNKTRKCDNPPPRNGGKKCEGSDITFGFKIQNLASFNDTCGTVTQEELKGDEEENGGKENQPVEDDYEYYPEF